MKIVIRTMRHGVVTRYVITADKRLFWSVPQMKWVPAMSQATLFDNHDRVVRAWRALRDNYAPDQPAKEYEATVKVYVRSDKPVDIEEIRRFLDANCEIIVDLEDEQDGASIDMEVDWDSLKEKP